MSRLLSLFERFDWLLLTAVLSLTAISLVALYGIGLSREPVDLFPFYKQLTAAGLGLAAVFVLSWLDYRSLRTHGIFLYLAGLALLLFVLILGRSIRGTQGWFRLGALSFQPVELAKLLLVIFLAGLMRKFDHGRLSWRTFGLSTVAVAPYVGLVLLQPDFGSAMIMLLSWGLMVLFAGLPRHAWLILPLVALLVGGVAWNFGLKPYQRDRISVFLNPNADPRGSGYNAAQARIAIGSGGLTGKGIGEGSQARLRFLPEAATDFMFAVLGEELGLIGLLVVLGLCLLLLARFLAIGYQSGDDFASLLLIGLGAVFLVHVFVNAGMNLGIMPITGIPFPFVSAAASSSIVAFLGIGLAESVATRRRGDTGKGIDL